MTPVVLDASAALHILAASTRFADSAPFHAPRLLRSEVLSALHTQVWRGVLPRDAAGEMRHRLEELSLSLFADELQLHERAWSVADELGWAKTYDAEYVALAQILEMPLLTADARLARGAEHLVRIMAPAEFGL